jgi:hypothetical protein
MVDKRGIQKIDCNHLPGDSTIKDSTGEDPVDRKMTRYQFMSLLHELLLLFISSFLLFPSRIKRIILCFVYSADHQSSFIYPSLEEEDLPSAFVVDVDLIPSPQPIHKDELCIEIPHEIDRPSQVSSPSVVTVEPCHQLVKPLIQPTSFQTRIRDKMFKPLRLPYHLHPYPLDFFEYFPRFSGEDHVTAERHVEAFENFIDQFEIVHEDVTMRLFSKSLLGDVVVWFKGLGADSIGSWIELCDTFLKCWGENKSFDQYLHEFTTLRRGKNEVLSVFNRRFYNLYYSLPLEIKPSETAAMVYYIMSQYSDLVLYLRERKSTSLSQLFMDVEEVEENLRACGRIQSQHHVSSEHEADFICCPYEEKIVDYLVLKACIFNNLSSEEATVSNIDQEQLVVDKHFDNEYLVVREHPETRHSECQESKVCYGQPIFDGNTSDGDEQNFSMVCLEPLGTIPVYDDYAPDPCKCYGGVERDFHINLISYPSPTNEQSCLNKNHMYEQQTIPTVYAEMISNQPTGGSEVTKQLFDPQIPMSVIQTSVPIEDIKQTVSSFETMKVTFHKLIRHCFQFHDPVNEYIELHFSNALEHADLIFLSACLGEYGFLDEFLSLLLHFKHQLLISDRDEVSSILKLLEWLLWKATFT